MWNMNTLCRFVHKKLSMNKCCNFKLAFSHILLKKTLYKERKECKDIKQNKSGSDLVEKRAHFQEESGWFSVPVFAALHTEMVRWLTALCVSLAVLQNAVPALQSAELLCVCYRHTAINLLHTLFSLPIQGECLSCLCVLIHLFIATEFSCIFFIWRVLAHAGSSMGLH